MTHEAALAALVDEVGAEFVDEWRGYMPEQLDEVVRLIAAGLCTARQAGEAVTRCGELADAVERGDLADAHGLAIVTAIGERHRGDRGAD